MNTYIFLIHDCDSFDSVFYAVHMVLRREFGCFQIMEDYAFQRYRIQDDENNIDFETWR